MRARANKRQLDGAWQGGTKADRAKASIVKLGRALAQRGRDGDGRPLYWMSASGSGGEVDDFDEHWGESAYVTALAYYHTGKTDASLRTAATQLTRGFAQNGSAPHMRSFNWQCRAAVATPFYLR